jgi:hypothetical protein
MPTLWQAIFLGLSAYLCGWLSWYYVEGPFRRLKLRPHLLIGSGLAASLIVCVTALFVWREAGFPSRVSPKVASMKSLETMWDWPCPLWIRLPWMPFDSCQFGAPWDTAKLKGIVIGDSHTQHIEPILQAAAEGRPWSFLEYYDCPASLGGHINRYFPIYYTHDYIAHCRQMRANGIRYLNDHVEINAVIFSASWTHLAETELIQDGMLPKSTTKLQMVGMGLRDYIEATARPGRTFVIIADIPQFPIDPAPCAIGALSALFRSKCELDHVSAKSFWAFQGDWYAAAAEIAQKRSDVKVVLPGKNLCVTELCTSYIDGEFLYRDSSHLRRNLDAKTRRDFSSAIGLTQTIEEISQVKPARQ